MRLFEKLRLALDEGEIHAAVATPCLAASKNQHVRELGGFALFAAGYFGQFSSRSLTSDQIVTMTVRVSIYRATEIRLKTHETEFQ